MNECISKCSARSPREGAQLSENKPSQLTREILPSNPCKQCIVAGPHSEGSVRPDATCIQRSRGSLPPSLLAAAAGRSWAGYEPKIAPTPFRTAAESAWCCRNRPQRCLLVVRLSVFSPPNVLYPSSPNLFRHDFPMPDEARSGDALGLEAAKHRV